MKTKPFLACVATIALTACAQTTPPAPSGQALSAAEIPELVGSGTYAVTIYDGEFAGTTGQSTWDFAAGTVSGNFTTAEGDTGTFEMPISIEGNTLCVGTDDEKQCHFIFEDGNGFAEVNPDGSLHAASRPI